MHIYAKQCEIMQKKSMKEVKRPNSLFLQLENSSAVLKHEQLGKLKRELLKIFKYYTISGVPPCERARPQLSKNVVLFGRTSF